MRHLRFDAPLVVVMNGRTSRGMIFKPQLTFAFSSSIIPLL